MSSLLQFNGEIKAGKVGLLFTKIRKEYYSLNENPPTGSLWQEVDIDVFECPKCGREHSVLYRAWRKPRGMMGCWVIFEYNGDKHVPDLSVPISIEKIPKDAERMSIEYSAKYWHS